MQWRESSRSRATARPDQPDWLQGFVVNLAVAFEATVPGTYKIEHSVDASSATVAMHVRPGEEA